MAVNLCVKQCHMLCRNIRSIARNSLFHLKAVRFTSTYKAAVIKEYGGAVCIEEMKRNSLQSNQVRVAVHNCGVNASDVLMMEDKYNKAVQLPFVPGCEVCGEVIEVGSDVKTLTIGQRVLGLNKETLGGFAEECIVSEKDAWPLDHAVSFEHGASLADNYGTALIALNRRANVDPSSTILITAAAGGLGLAAVDLAANVYKGKVIGVCGTEDKADLVREKGAWAALKYNQKHLEKKVREVTDNKGVDVLFDAVGGEVFTNSLPCVAHEGRVIVAGFASRIIPHIETSQLLPKAISVIGVSLSQYRLNNYPVYRQAIEDVIEMHSEHLITPHISAMFPLEELPKALAFIQERKSTGKVVLKLR